MPIVEWRLFRNRSYAGATGYVLLSNLVMYTTLVSIPFFIEEVQGKGSAASGTLLGAMSITVAVAAPLGGRLSDSLGRRAPALAGSLFALLGVVMLLVGISPGVSYAYLGVSLAVLGLGIGLSSGPASTAAVESVSHELAGTASGTNSMMRYLGSIIGVGILGAILSEGSDPDVSLFRGMFAVLLVVATFALAATLLIHRRLPAPDEEPAPAGSLQAGSPAALSGS